MAVKLPNPKYIPKPYEKMRFPGERVQIDVKFVPEACIVGDAAGEKFYQYTAIDEFSRWRYLEAFQEHSTYSSAQFLEHLIKAAPFKILCVQTDNGTEFTKRLLPGDNGPSLFETRLEQAGAVVAREQAFCKLGAVIRLDTQDFEWSCFDQVLKELGRGISAMLLKGFQIPPAGELIDCSILVKLLACCISNDAGFRNELDIDLNSFARKAHLFIRLWDVFGIGQLNSHLSLTA